jgi:hypothetical protein
MSISSISAASLAQSVLTSSNSNKLRQTLQSLQNSLSSGDLNGAQSAFQTLQQINQGLATTAGTNSNESQLSSDLTSLGSALSSGDLSTAQSALTAVQADLKSSASPSQTTETSAASQSEQLVSELLSTLNSNTSSSGASDLTTSVLEKVYGSRSLNVQA